MLGGEHIDFELWQGSGVGKFTDLFIQKKFITFAYLYSRVPGVTQFQYYQVKSTVTTMMEKNVMRTTMKDFEQIVNSGMIFRNTLPTIYKVSLKDDMTADVSRLNWQKNVRREITPEELILTQNILES